MRSNRSVGHVIASLRAFVLLMLLPTVCHAGGFALNEYSARANGMGGAMIAIADDASAVAYNPAGITQTWRQHDVRHDRHLPHSRRADRLRR